MEKVLIIACILKKLCYNGVQLLKNRRRREGLKTFFDGVFVDSNNVQNENEYPIKLEYYKTIKTEESVEAKYGIEVVETEFLKGKVNVESKKIENLVTSSEEIDRILTFLKDNQVTPIGIEDAINEIEFL